MGEEGDGVHLMPEEEALTSGDAERVLRITAIKNRFVAMIYIYKYVYMYICIYVYIYICEYICICMYICIYVYI